ncbi:hypothetical protein F4802DRAFT_594824 [Xylaria palmicola]|nr:hypothetical protein F4802DRAFT_594824 [Xylaria palmicola]
MESKVVLDTPLHAKIRGQVKLNDAFDLGLSQRRIFAFNNVSQETRRRALQSRDDEVTFRGINRGPEVTACSDPNARTIHNDPRLSEQRGAFIEDAGVVLPKNISERTLERAFDKLGIKWHPEHVKASLLPKSKQQRVERAQRKVDLGLWADFSWRRRVISFNGLHWGLHLEGQEGVYRKERDHAAWWNVKPSGDKMDRQQRRQEEKLS